MKKGILSLILTFCVSLGLICPIYSVNAETLAVGEDIEQELKDVDLTPYELANKTDVITLSEVGFGTEDYKLIVYVYNATGKKFYKGTTESNVINMATNHDEDLNATEYSNLRLRYISSTKDDKIYKFSVIDEAQALKKYFEKMQETNKKRRYDVSGIQLLTVGDNLAHDYNVSKSYVYSGQDSTLSITSLEGINLKVYPTWYRTATSDEGAYMQHQLNSVYFSIPNKYFEDGYKLNKIKAEWYEYKTDSIIVVNDKERYNRLNEVKGIHVSEFDENELTPALTTKVHTTDTLVPTSSCLWSYNWVGPWHESAITTDRITLLFNKGITESVKSDELKTKIYSYDASADKGYLPIKNGQVSADLFQDSVDEGRTIGYNEVIISADETYDLLSYDSTHNLWDKICDFGFWDVLFGVNEEEKDYIGIKKIYEVTDADVKTPDKVADTLLIDSDHVSDFVDYYNKSKNIGKSKTFLFRFADTDYKSIPITGSHKSGRYNNLNTYGYVAWETVFLDFDIIHLEFSNGDNTLVIPVNCDPIDHIADVDPIQKPDGGWIWWLVGAAGVCVLITIFVSSALKEN